MRPTESDAKKMTAVASFSVPVFEAVSIMAKTPSHLAGREEVGRQRGACLD
jgi:hypothetical protein